MFSTSFRKYLIFYIKFAIHFAKIELKKEKKPEMMYNLDDVAVSPFVGKYAAKVYYTLKKI